MDRNHNIMKSPHSKHILPVPWPFAMMRFYCCAMQKALQSSTGKCVKVNAKLSINNVSGSVSTIQIYGKEMYSNIGVLMCLILHVRLLELVTINHLSRLL